MIVERTRGGKTVFCVVSEKQNPSTGKKREFGCYNTRAQAEARLKQVEMFKHMAKGGRCS
jgi:hypothetical protein